MTTLLIVGFVSGLVTAISPCVLPVLPVVLTTSVAVPLAAVRRDRRPGAVVRHVHPAGRGAAQPAEPAAGPAALGRDRGPRRRRSRAGVATLRAHHRGTVRPGTDAPAEPGW